MKKNPPVERFYKIAQELQWQYGYENIDDLTLVNCICVEVQKLLNDLGVDKTLTEFLKENKGFKSNYVDVFPVRDNVCMKICRQCGYFNDRLPNYGSMLSRDSFECHVNGNWSLNREMPLHDNCPFYLEQIMAKDLERKVLGITGVTRTCPVRKN